MTTSRFKITLVDAETDCWREVEITPEKTLEKLAEGIVNAFNFDFDHAFGFYDRLDERYFDSSDKYELFADMDDGFDQGNTAKSVRKTKTKDVFTAIGQKMQFVFDYGDEWRFLIEYIGNGEKVPRKRYPSLVQSHGTAPEQYPDWEEDEDEEFSGFSLQTGKVIPFPQK